MYRRYAILSALGMLAVTLALGWVGRQFQPLWGDLARTGWRSENDFGWTLPQQRFEPPAAQDATPEDHFDIIAIGDSFTAEFGDRAGTTWPHFLAQSTGLKIGIYDSGEVSLDAVLTSPGFRAAPPAALIYEIVERHLVPNHPSAAGEPCPTEPAPPVSAGLHRRPAGPPPQVVMRPMTRAWDDLPVTYAASYLSQNLLRLILGRETTVSVLLDLNRTGLFSSRRDTGLLVYGEDFNKQAWTEADWHHAACNLLRMQRKVEANGRTSFIVLVAPDKLSAYSPFLVDVQYRGISRLDILAQYPALHFVNMAPLLDPAQAIDLYLPDDTHWSGQAHALAARAVERRLIELGGLTE